MRYEVCVQLSEEEATAWVPALPGCFCIAPKKGEAVARAPAAIAEYLGWLRHHGEEVPLDDGYEVQVVEEVEALGERGEPCFAADRVAATEEEIETAIRRMGYARQDLLTLVEPLPDEVLDWQPTAEKWSIRRIMGHIASADGYYRTALLEQSPPGRDPPEERSNLTLQRERAIAHLRSLTAAQRVHVFHPHWPWRWAKDEEWPVSKALRRFVYHERFHARDIGQTLAWLMLGGP